jgi:hypothetical protein
MGLAGLLNIFGKRKIPLKIKVWLWLIWHNAIASKENIQLEGGLETPNVRFVIKRKQFIISFSHVHLLSMFRVV